MTTIPEEWMKEHEKTDKASFDAIHTHIDRLDKATNNDLVLYKVDELFLKLDALDKKIDKKYVTREQFEPVRNIVYGMVGLLLTGIIVGVARMIIK